MYACNCFQFVDLPTNVVFLNSLFTGKNTVFNYYLTKLKYKKGVQNCFCTFSFWNDFLHWLCCWLSPLFRLWGRHLSPPLSSFAALFIIVWPQPQRRAGGHSPNKSIYSISWNNNIFIFHHKKWLSVNNNIDDEKWCKFKLFDVTQFVKCT